MRLRLLRDILSLLIITSMGLVYVHQQIELVKLSYTIGHKEKKLEYLLDHKENLEYNINNLEAPSRLERVLVSRKIDITFPKRGQIVKLAKKAPDTQKSSLRTAGIEGKVNGFFGIFEFFGLGTEAHAKER